MASATETMTPHPPVPDQVVQGPRSINARNERSVGAIVCESRQEAVPAHLTGICTGPDRCGVARFFHAVRRVDLWKAGVLPRGRAVDVAVKRIESMHMHRWTRATRAQSASSQCMHMPMLGRAPR